MKERRVQKIEATEIDTSEDVLDLCPGYEAISDLFDFKRILEELLTFQNWLTQTKSREYEKQKAAIYEVINANTDLLFTTDDAVRELMMILFRLRD